MRWIGLRAAWLQLAGELKPTLPVAELRGHEGEAARMYFSVFDHLIVGDKEGFLFRGGRGARRWTM